MQIVETIVLCEFANLLFISSPSIVFSRIVCALLHWPRKKNSWGRTICKNLGQNHQQLPIESKRTANVGRGTNILVRRLFPDVRSSGVCEAAGVVRASWSSFINTRPRLSG